MGSFSYVETGQTALMETIKGVHQVIDALFEAQVYELLSIVPHEDEHNSTLVHLFQTVGEYLYHTDREQNRPKLFSKVRHALSPLESYYTESTLDTATEFMLANLAQMEVPEETYPVVPWDNQYPDPPI